MLINMQTKEVDVLEDALQFTKESDIIIHLSRHVSCLHDTKFAVSLTKLFILLRAICCGIHFIVSTTVVLLFSCLCVSLFRSQELFPSPAFELHPVDSPSLPICVTRNRKLR